MAQEGVRVDCKTAQERPLSSPHLVRSKHQIARLALVLGRSGSQGCELYLRAKGDRPVLPATREGCFGFERLLIIGVCSQQIIESGLGPREQALIALRNS